MPRMGLRTVKDPQPETRTGRRWHVDDSAAQPGYNLGVLRPSYACSVASRLRSSGTYKDDSGGDAEKSPFLNWFELFDDNDRAILRNHFHQAIDIDKLRCVVVDLDSHRAPGLVEVDDEAVIDFFRLVVFAVAKVDRQRVCLLVVGDSHVVSLSVCPEDT